MANIVCPNAGEIEEFLLATLRHSCHVEYYLYRLNFGENDPQRPHDIEGPGNKYSWETVKGMALSGRAGINFEKYILPSLEIHRQQQHHHQMWNKPYPKGVDDDMRLGAVDAICSLLEPRTYQGGTHSFQDIPKIIEQTMEHKKKWMYEILSKMEAIKVPEIERIINLENIPNIGLPDKIYQSILQRTICVLNDFEYWKENFIAR